MRKNDKLIVIMGVVILLISSIGIFLWVPDTTGGQGAEIEDLYSVCGVLSSVPDSITVADSDPFYALIATPLAVHYNADGEQEVIPLYVKNFEEPSRAIDRAEELIGITPDEIISNSKSTKEVSLELAEEYWESSDGVLLIENNQSGYNLGVLATPLASYLSIPVIVIDELDEDVRVVLEDLGVRFSIVCGNISGFGDVLRFDNVDEIVNASIEMVREKFGDVDYITLTNPIDVRKPEVLNKTVIVLGPVKLPSTASTQLLEMVKGGGNPVNIGSFTIPKDYKYALVKFEGVNLHSEDVDELSDHVFFFVGPNIADLPDGQQMSGLCYGNTGAGGIPIRDSTGNIIIDRYYTESVLYKRGGIEYIVRAMPQWLATKEGEVKATITIEKLSDPIYPMMKGLSSIAPYLTAYHNGIIFGKPEFAFVADDMVTTLQEEICPGFYMPSKNTKLLDLSNSHVIKIHEELNQLLAKLSDISANNLKNLRNYYRQNPVYVALVGGATVLPQGIYDNYLAPVDDSGAASIYLFGAGTPSDVIYGNIDPVPGDWSNTANDIFSYYPYQENIVGRITGWDAQDASALVARTIFYNDIIEEMGDWKNNAVVQGGDGSDFQKPLIRYKILGDMLNIVRHGEPMKMPTGFSKFTDETMQKKVLEPMGFVTEKIAAEEAGRKGFSDEAFNKLKKANVLNKLLFPRYKLTRIIGEDVVRGGELQEKSNFIFGRCHGWHGLFTFSNVYLSSLGLGYIFLPQITKSIARIIGFGPGSSLTIRGQYNTREVENMDLGPSFFWLDSCTCGKIDGLYPKNSIGQAYLHAGAGAIIMSTTESNIAGGYLEPKKSVYELPGQPLIRYLKAKKNVNNGIYPDQHFGPKMYGDLCEELMENDVSIGVALRNARNRYLPEDANWTLWWAPPLITTGNPWQDYEIAKGQSEIAKNMVGNAKSPMIKNKYITYQEFTLYGDPAFTPYVPCDNKI